MDPLFSYIRERAEAWSNDRVDYSHIPAPVFMDAYKKAGTQYVDPCAKLIMEAYDLPAGFEDTVCTLVYLANQETRRQEESKRDAEWERQGFALDIEAWAKSAPDASRVKVVVSGTNIVGGEIKRIVENCRLIRHDDGRIRGVMPPRSRRRGYLPEQIYAIKNA